MGFWVVFGILEVGLLCDSLFEELCDLALEVRLPAEHEHLPFVLEEIQRCLTLVIPGQAQTVANDHLFDKVVLGVLNYSKSHDV